jgi:hypothetical protein
MSSDYDMVIGGSSKPIPSSFLPHVPMGNQPSQSQIIEESDIGRAIAELNDDSVEAESKMSRIDMRSRLGNFEISALLSCDMLIGMKFLPETMLHLTRQKKRLAVSKNGLGRQEIVELVVGERKHQTSTNPMSAFLNKKV